MRQPHPVQGAVRRAVRSVDVIVAVDIHQPGDAGLQAPGEHTDLHCSAQVSPGGPPPSRGEQRGHPRLIRGLRRTDEHSTSPAIASAHSSDYASAILPATKPPRAHPAPPSAAGASAPAGPAPAPDHRAPTRATPADLHTGQEDQLPNQHQQEFLFVDRPAEPQPTTVTLRNWYSRQLAIRTSICDRSLADGEAGLVQIS